MDNVIDFQKVLKEKEEQSEKRKRELDKRRRFTLNMDEANILINSYINYINSELEEFKELITEEDKQIGRNEIKTMFSLLRMLFKKYKSLDYYDEVVMSWNYKNLYYTIMASYASLDADDEYEFLGQEDKIELNLYYRLVDLDHEIGEIIYGSSAHLSEMPGWMREQELEAENEYELFKYQFSEEFLNKVVLMQEPSKKTGVYYVRSYPDEFKEVLKEFVDSGEAEYDKSSYPKGWRVSVEWDELVKALFGFNVEVVSLSEQEIEEVSHIYSVELLEEQIANIINRMENLGMKISDSFINNE